MDIDLILSTNIDLWFVGLTLALLACCVCYPVKQDKATDLDKLHFDSFIQSNTPGKGTSIGKLILFTSVLGNILGQYMCKCSGHVLQENYYLVWECNMEAIYFSCFLCNKKQYRRILCFCQICS